MTHHDQITQLAPTPEPFDAEWSHDTLVRILAEEPAITRTSRPWWRTTRRRAAVLAAVGVVAVSAGTAVAGGGPGAVIKDALIDFSHQPDAAVRDLDGLSDPELVAKFQTERGLFAIWIASTTSGQVCYGYADGTWDGTSPLTKEQFDYGCGGEIMDPSDPDRSMELTRPDQFGGFFKDTDGPIIYGVSPYAEAVSVRVQAPGVDRTLPVRADSHGFGAALPEATDDRAVTLTFLDDAGDALGSAPTRWVAPVG